MRYVQGRLPPKQPGFKSDYRVWGWSVDAGELQMSEPTTEEHLGTKALLKI